MAYDDLIKAFALQSGMDGLEVQDGAVAFDIDGMRVALLHDRDADAVLVLGDVGSPPPEEERRFSALLLQSNHLFRRTGGATFAQNPETGTYVLMRSLPLPTLDAATLSSALEAFANTLERWRRILADYRPADDNRSNAADPAGDWSAPTLGSSGFMPV